MRTATAKQKRAWKRNQKMMSWVWSQPEVLARHKENSPELGSTMRKYIAEYKKEFNVPSKEKT